jgi:hypothetical protein
MCFSRTHKAYEEYAHGGKCDNGEMWKWENANVKMWKCGNGKIEYITQKI